MLLQMDDKTAAVVEVNSETDFVAKNAEFQTLCYRQLLNRLLTLTAADIDSIPGRSMESRCI